MPYFAAIAAAAALYFHLRSSPGKPTVSHSQVQDSGDLGASSDLTGQDLAQLYLDELRQAQQEDLSGFSTQALQTGSAPGSFTNAVAAASVPVSPQPIMSGPTVFTAPITSGGPTDFNTPINVTTAPNVFGNPGAPFSSYTSSAVAPASAASTPTHVNSVQ